MKSQSKVYIDTIYIKVSNYSGCNLFASKCPVSVPRASRNGERLSVLLLVFKLHINVVALIFMIQLVVSNRATLA